ncbi:MAG: PAS domain S-box protein [Alphaproteobacteria bacterium]|nr:PAS domain S-box protein [Alphaproteobacteria bacterium]
MLESVVPSLVRAAGVCELASALGEWVEAGFTTSVGLWRLRGDRTERVCVHGLPEDWRPPQPPGHPWSELSARGRVRAPGLRDHLLHLLRRGDEVVGLVVLPVPFRPPALIPLIGETLGRCVDADAARQRATTLDELLALVSDGVIVASADGEMIGLSRSMSEAVGWTAEEIREHGWTNLVYPDPDVRADVQRGIAALVRGVPSEGVVRTLARKDGGEVRMAIWSRLVPNPAGGAPAMIGLMRDVTTAEDTRRRAAREEGLAQLGRIAGGIAHEYNNLLCAVMGHAELIGLTPGVPAGVERRAETILRSARRGAYLSSRLLAFTGTASARPAAVDLAQAVRQVVDLYTPRLPPDVRVVLDLEPNVPPGEVDPNLLQQALINLVVNAAEAMPEGGTIGIGVRADHLPADVRFRAADAPPVGAAMVAVTVRDRGTGFSTEALERLFEPFFTSKKDGHGMGLPAVRNVAATHRGCVEVVNDDGAVITLWLPASTRPEVAMTRLLATGEGGAVRIWILDDQEAVLEFSRVSLEAEGHQVRTFSSVQQILGAEGEPPDLLVLDLQLPDGDGASVYHELRQRGVGARVLWSTGHTPESVVVPEDSGPVLQKPYTGVDLVAAVNRVVGTNG